MIRAGMKCKCLRARGLSLQVATSRQACPRGSLRPASTKPVCQARLAHPNRLCPGIGCQSARTWPHAPHPLGTLSPDGVRWLADWQTSSISTAGGGEGFGDTISIDPKIYGKPRASLLPSINSHPPYPPLLPARRRRSRACLPRSPPCARPPAFACMFGCCTVSFVT